MMSRKNQSQVEELLNYGFTPKAIHRYTGLSLNQIYQIQEEIYDRKARQKEIQSKKDVK